MKKKWVLSSLIILFLISLVFYLIKNKKEINNSEQEILSANKSQEPHLIKGNMPTPVFSQIKGKTLDSDKCYKEAFYEIKNLGINIPISTQSLFYGYFV